MSMLSSQVDELREIASELREVYGYNFDWTHEEAVTLASSVDCMREAADTIESLRDRLQATSETCELEETETLKNVTAHVLECSACGRTCEHVNGDYPRCPYCGRLVKR